MTPITDGRRDLMPDWSGAGIVFSSDRAGPTELWVVQPDGTGLQKLAKTGSLFDPRWDTGTPFVLASEWGQGGSFIGVFEPGRGPPVEAILFGR